MGSYRRGRVIGLLITLLRAAHLADSRVSRASHWLYIDPF